MKQISDDVIRRLPLYLRRLDELYSKARIQSYLELYEE